MMKQQNYGDVECIVCEGTWYINVLSTLCINISTKKWDKIFKCSNDDKEKKITLRIGIDDIVYRINKTLRRTSYKREKEEMVFY